MDNNLDNKYYMLTTQRSSVGVGGNTVWWFDSKLEAIEEIINYFSIVRLAFEYLEDDDPEALEEFDNAIMMLEAQGETSPDNVIESINLDYGDSNGINIYGKGIKVLLKIVNELKYEIENRYFEEDVNYEDWLSGLLKKIESDDLSIFDELEKINECLYCC